MRALALFFAVLIGLAPVLAGPLPELDLAELDERALTPAQCTKVNAIVNLLKLAKATAFCSSFLGIGTATVTATVTVTGTATTTATASVTLTTGTVTATADTITGTVTATSTEVVTSTTLTTVTAAIEDKRDLGQRAINPKPQVPAYLRGFASSAISAACSCLDIATTTKTNTVPARASVTVTATSTATISVAATTTTTPSTTATVTSLVTTTITATSTATVPPEAAPRCQGVSDPYTSTDGDRWDVSCDAYEGAVGDVQTFYIEIADLQACIEACAASSDCITANYFVIRADFRICQGLRQGEARTVRPQAGDATARLIGS